MKGFVDVDKQVSEGKGACEENEEDKDPGGDEAEGPVRIEVADDVVPIDPPQTRGPL